MSHQVKTAPLTMFKATDPAAGTFTAVVAVFGNVDLVGDRIIPGAFTASLKEWGESGDPIPVIWSHRWEDPDMHIGALTSAVESPDGLLVTGVLDLDAPVAAQVYRLLSGRRVKEFSFAYDVRDSREAEGGVLELTDLSVIEVGPTLRGANPATSLLDVKAAPAQKAAALDSDAPPAPAPAPAPPPQGAPEPPAQAPEPPGYSREDPGLIEELIRAQDAHTDEQVLLTATAPTATPTTPTPEREPS